MATEKDRGAGAIPVNEPHRFLHWQASRADVESWAQWFTQRGIPHRVAGHGRRWTIYKHFSKEEGFCCGSREMVFGVEALKAQIATLERKIAFLNAGLRRLEEEIKERDRDLNRKRLVIRDLHSKLALSHGTFRHQGTETGRYTEDRGEGCPAPHGRKGPA